ncbi:MAG: hypothetical protein LC799_35250, partial [Actinobacteria bacterium]|nr:hypothetical protein [Actinomycetota bacterium]
MDDNNPSRSSNKTVSFIPEAAPYRPALSGTHRGNDKKAGSPRPARLRKILRVLHRPPVMAGLPGDIGPGGAGVSHGR